jgi:MoaA/NifB/PqqE/SkfB family radical SAM enzyme
MLAGIDEITDIALTTNGSALTAKAKTLKDAGLTRVSVSLDALDDQTFAAMSDVGFPVARVLAGIEAAAAAGLTPVKVNMVVKRGVNDLGGGDDVIRAPAVAGADVHVYSMNRRMWHEPRSWGTQPAYEIDQPSRTPRTPGPPRRRHVARGC